jgi:hypothetical protein
LPSGAVRAEDSPAQTGAHVEGSPSDDASAPGAPPQDPERPSAVVPRAAELVELRLEPVTSRRPAEDSQGLDSQGLNDGSNEAPSEESGTPPQGGPGGLRDGDRVPHDGSARTRNDRAARVEATVEARGDDASSDDRAAGAVVLGDALEDMPEAAGSSASKGASAVVPTDSFESLDDEGAPSHAVEYWEDEELPRSRRWLPWATLGGVTAALAATWIAWAGTTGEPASPVLEESRSGASSITVQSTQPEGVREAESPRERRDEHRGTSMLASADARPAAPVGEEGGPGMGAGGDKGSREPARVAGADADACKKTRASAEEATRLLEWGKVLRMTKQRGCWTGATHRRDRQRLRVQAYAELGEFAKCVREAGESTDTVITSRVGYCMSGLRAG